MFTSERWSVDSITLKCPSCERLNILGRDEYRRELKRARFRCGWIVPGGGLCPVPLRELVPYVGRL